MPYFKNITEEEAHTYFKEVMNKPHSFLLKKEDETFILRSERISYKNETIHIKISEGYQLNGDLKKCFEYGTIISLHEADMKNFEIEVEWNELEKIAKKHSLDISGWD